MPIKPVFRSTAAARRTGAKITAAVALVAAAGLALSGCSSSSGTTTSTAKPNYGSINVQLSWIKDSEFAGEYIADTKGYYKAAGFSSVNFVAGPGSTETVVASNKALIGLTDGVSAGTAVVNSKAPVKIIGTTFQKNPFTIASLVNGADITTPQDLIGKKIGVQASNETLFKALLKVNNIPLSKVTIVPVQYDPSVLTSGQVDGYLAFLTDEDIALEEKGYKIANLPFADNGLEFVADAVEASDESIKDHPAELEAFLYATIKGWKAAAADPALGVDLAVNTYGKSVGLNKATETKTTTAFLALQGGSSSSDGPFSISPSLIKANIATLSAAGITISSSDLFDMSLLKDVYKQHPDLLK